MSGKAIAAEVRDEVKRGVAAFAAAHGVKPGLTVVIVGDDPASQVYVSRKHKACSEMGMYSEVVWLPATASEEQLLAVIDRVNADPAMHGLLVQLPLPRHIDGVRVLERIRPEKDVDGFHPLNVGNLCIGKENLVACTPYGVIKMLEASGIPVEGKRAVVIGRSNIVGKPLALLLLARNATVTVCHSHTRDLAAVARKADILVAAVGQPNFVTRDMVKPGAVVIDVGINRLDGKLVGDVNFAEVAEVAGVITPVPGGVGLLTVAMLMRNTLRAAELQMQPRP